MVARPLELMHRDMRTASRAGAPPNRYRADITDRRIRHSGCRVGAVTGHDRTVPLNASWERKQDTLVVPWIALRTAWLAKQNCDAHRICDFGAVALPERTAVLFTRSYDQPG